MPQPPMLLHAPLMQAMFFSTVLYCWHISCLCFSDICYDYWWGKGAELPCIKTDLRKELWNGLLMQVGNHLSYFLLNKISTLYLSFSAHVPPEIKHSMVQYSLVNTVKNNSVFWNAAQYRNSQSI
jgi:hypothetical protein